jgi:hypothetical protein
MMKKKRMIGTCAPIIRAVMRHQSDAFAIAVAALAAAAIARAATVAIAVSRTLAAAITRTAARALSLALARVFACRTRSAVRADTAIGFEAGLLASGAFFFGLGWSAEALARGAGWVLSHGESSAEEEDGQQTGHGFRFHGFYLSWLWFSIDAARVATAMD